MSTRFLRITLGIDSATDQARSQKQFYRDKHLDASGMGIDNLVTGAIAAEGSYVVPFGKVALARLVVVEVTGELLAIVNGAAAGIAVAPLPGATMPGVAAAPGRWILETKVTSLRLDNPSITAAVEFVVYLLGT